MTEQPYDNIKEYLKQDLDIGYKLPATKYPFYHTEQTILSKYTEKQTYAPHTIGAKMVELLKKHGLFASDLDDILALVVEENAATSEVIHNAAEGYPIELMASIWEVTRIAAIEWIDENRPKHFARPLLANKMPPNVLVDELT